MGDDGAGRNGRRASRRRPPPADIRWAWFFDIDGTLVELASEPSGIVLEDEMARLLKGDARILALQEKSRMPHNRWHSQRNARSLRTWLVKR